MDVPSFFTAAKVPAVGPEEIPIDPPNGRVSPDEGIGLPGKGLAPHPVLYIGEPPPRAPGAFPRTQMNYLAATQKKIT